MKNQIRNGLGAIICAALALLMATSASAAEAQGENPLLPFERFIGTWETAPNTRDGKTFNMRVEYQWALNKKLLKVKSFMVTDGKENQIYETVVSWRPDRKKITFMSFSMMGTLFDGTVDEVGEKFTYNFLEVAESGSTAYRQTITFPDKDTYSWVVFKKTDSDWEKVFDVPWHRKS